MNDYLQLEHQTISNKKTTIINWCLGNTCNYSCSYCPESLHSGSVRWVNYEVLLSFCKKLVTHYRSLNQRTEFLFTGGEPTLYPHLPALLYELKIMQCEVGIISNGSRTLNWWQKVVKYLDTVVLTHHIESVNLAHFISVADYLCKSATVNINITMLPSTFDECLKNAEKIYSDCSNVSISLKPLLQNFGDTLYEYSDTQKEILSQKRFPPKLKRKAATRGMMKKLFANGAFIDQRASDFILNKENNWKGWHCNIGIELLYIDYKGDIYRGTCRQGGKIGNVTNSAQVQFPKTSIICDKNTCHCLTDIMISKKNLS